MPLETIQPDAVGPLDQWTLGAGASKVDATKLPDDDDTSYIDTITVALIQEFECADPIAILSADTIDSVTLKGRARLSGGGPMVRFGLRVGNGTLGEGANHTLTGSWADYSDIFVQTPDAANWTLADLIALRIRVLFVSGAVSTPRVTTLVAEIAYTRASDKSQHIMTLGVG